MDDTILRLVENGSSDDSLEARIRHNVLDITVEVEDVQGRGSYVRTRFMPTRAQAEQLSVLLAAWSRA